MGRPKLLLPWGETTILGHLLRQWRELHASQIAVVHAHHDQNLCQELDRLDFPGITRIPNPEPARGMFSSILCAANWIGWKSELTHWAISLGDQPHLQPTTLLRLLEFASSHLSNICQPSRSGRPRHPVILPRKTFASLRNTSAKDLKSFLQQNGTARALCEIDDPGLDLDLDTWSDYEQALRLAARPAK